MRCDGKHGALCGVRCTGLGGGRLSRRAFQGLHPTHYCHTYMPAYINAVYGCLKATLYKPVAGSVLARSSLRSGEVRDLPRM